MKNLLIILLLIPICLNAQEVTIHESVTNIEISDLKHMTVTEKRVLTIHDEKAYDYAVFYGADSRFTSISKLKMTIYDANGKKVKKLGKGNSSSTELKASYEVSDVSYIVLDPEYQHYPFKIELETETKFNKGFMNIADWVPRDDFRVAVEHAELTLSYPMDIKINVYMEHIDNPEKIIDGGYEIMKWKIDDLPSIDHDISSKQFWDEQPKVYMSPEVFELDGFPGSFESWQAYGNWFYDLNDDSYEFTDKTKSFLDQLDEPDLASTVQAIYKYMQNRTRYVSIQLGIGGWQSLPAGFVDENGYGDCKALSNYMRSMLDYKGIPANYVLVKAGDNQPNIKSQYMMNQFNHVFLGIPGEQDTIYLECTNQQIPTGYLGTFTDDRDVLWVGANNTSQIIHSPVYDESINVLRRQSEITLDPYGNGTMDVIQEKSGLFYEDIQLFKSITKEQREDFVYKQFDFRDFVIKDFTYGEVEDEDPIYASKMKILANNIARNTSNRLLLPVNIFPGPDNYFTFNQFQHFAEIKRNFMLEDRITITLPEKFFIDQLPKIPGISSDYGDYTCTVKDLEDGRIQIKRQVILRKGEYKNKSFEDFNDFMKEIKAADRSKLVIQTGT